MHDKIDELLEKDGMNDVCDACPYGSFSIEHHPFGSTTAAEYIGECVCDDDDQCPRLANTP